MTEHYEPSDSAASARPDSTTVMPPVTPDAQAQMGPGTGPPPKRGMPPWAWALLGAAIVVLLLGAFALGRGMSARQAVTEATATVSLEDTAQSGATEVGVAGGSGSSGDVVVSEDTAASGSGAGSGSSGDAGASGGSADAGAASGGSDAGGSSDAGAASEEPIGDGGGEETVVPQYRSVLKVTGNREYLSAPIRLERGHMELTIHVTRTTHHRMAAQFERAGGGGPNTWWSTTNAVDGMTRVVEVNVPSATTFRYRVLCDPGSGWSLRVRWKP